MKYFLNLIAIIMLSISFLAFYPMPEQPAASPVAENLPAGIDIPDQVKSVLDRSCLPCHGPDGKFKAKMKWDFEKMDEYDKTKMISKLVKIAEVVEEEKMPPKNFVKKNPENKLSADEIKLLKDWAEGTAESMTGGTE